MPFHGKSTGGFSRAGVRCRLVARNPAPIQTAQAEEKPPAVEQAVVLPETGSAKELLIGVAIAIGVALLVPQSSSCDLSSSDCGSFPGTATTGTR
jgi:hypothetical protein